MARQATVQLREAPLSFCGSVTSLFVESYTRQEYIEEQSVAFRAVSRRGALLTMMWQEGANTPPAVCQMYIYTYTHTPEKIYIPHTQQYIDSKETVSELTVPNYQSHNR